MKLFNRLLKNSLSNSVAFSIEAMVAFLMMPFVVKYLGDSAYGVWVLINILTGYLGLFKMGFRPSINKHVAEYKATEDFKGLQLFMGASLHIYIYVSLVILISSVVIAYFLPVMFEVDSDVLTSFQILLLLAGFQSACSLVGTAYGGVISGYQRYEINAAIEIGVILLRAMLILYFLPFFPNLYTMAAAHFSLTILGYLVTMIWAKKLAPLTGLPVIKKPGKAILKTILKYNSISFSIAALSIIINFVDSIVVGMILPLSMITHYVVGDRLVKYCLTLLNVSTKVIAPAVSELKAINNLQLLNSLLINTHKFSCVLIYPVLITLYIQGSEFIRLWMGPGYEDSYQIMQVLAISALFIAPSQFVNSYLYGLAKHQYLLYILAIETLTAVPLSILLGKMNGAIGVAIGISIPRVITRSMVLPLLVNQISKQNVFLAFLKNIISTLFVCLPFGFFLWWFKTTFFVNSWQVYMLQLLCACCIYLFCVYQFALNHNQKRQLLDLFALLCGKFRLRRE